MFFIPTISEYNKFKQFILQLVEFEYPHHVTVSPPLTLHSYNSKVSFTDFTTVQKIGAESQNQPL